MTKRVHLIDLNGATFRLDQPFRKDNPFQTVTLTVPAEIDEEGYTNVPAMVISTQVHKDQIKELAEALLISIGLGE